MTMINSFKFKSEMQSSATFIVFVSLVCVASSWFYGYGFYEEVSQNTQLLESLHDTTGELSKSDMIIVEELKTRLIYNRLGYAVCVVSVLIFSYLVVANFSGAITEIKFFFSNADAAAPALANVAETFAHVTPQAASYFSSFPAGTLPKVDTLISAYEGSKYSTPAAKAALLELYPKIFGDFGVNAFSKFTLAQTEGIKIKIVYSFVQACQVSDPADYIEYMSTNANVSDSMRSATRFISAFYNSVKS